MTVAAPSHPLQLLEPLSRQRLDLHSHGFERAVGNALSSRVDPTHQKIAVCWLGYLVKTEQLVGSRSKSGRYANECREVWLSVATDIVSVPAFAQAAASCGFRVRYAQFVRQALQVSTKRIHGNVLFWKINSRHELNGVVVEHILFVLSFDRSHGEMR